MPECADELREVAVRDSGLVGEGSREARGEGAADDEADVAEAEAEVETCDCCEGNRDEPDSAIGVTVAVLADDSRDSVGCSSGSCAEPTRRMFGDLSMALVACEQRQLAVYEGQR